MPPRVRASCCWANRPRGPRRRRAALDQSIRELRMVPTMSTSAAAVPTAISDPINAQILAISEDKIQGFQTDPIGEIARLSRVEVPTVIERIAAMLRAGTI